VVGQFQQANFGEGVGHLGQQPDELGALFDKLIHATTPESEKRTSTPDVGRVNGAQQLGSGRVIAAEDVSAETLHPGNDSGIVPSRTIEMGDWHSEVAYAAFPPPPLDVL
jgi:hypothetical protein